MSYKHSNTKNSKGHLKFKERELIERWLNEGKSQAEIAQLLGRNRSTISREIKRGTVPQIIQGKKVELYLADSGAAIYLKNRQRCVSKGLKAYSSRFWYKLKKAFYNGWFKGKNRLYSIKTFVLKYSRDNPKEKVPCFKTVYRYIRKNVLVIKPHDLPVMYRLSPRKNKHSKPKGHNKKVLGNSISTRPVEVLNRETFGHWEADLVLGKKTKNEPVIMTLVERKTRYALALKLKDSKSQTIFDVCQSVIKRDTKSFKSITFDNGSEFSKVSELETNDLSIYFCHAYSAWERGSNENFNKLLREFVPKGQSLHQFSSGYVEEAATKINQRIREILDLESAQACFEYEQKQLNK